jgi:hypothetical protein
MYDRWITIFTPNNILFSKAKLFYINCVPHFDRKYGKTVACYKIVGVQSRNKCSLWNVERKEWAGLVSPVV